VYFNLFSAKAQAKIGKLQKQPQIPWDFMEKLVKTTKSTRCRKLHRVLAND